MTGAGSARRALLGLVLAASVAVAASFAVGVGLGALSKSLWVIGLDVMVLGLVVGVALAALLGATGRLGMRRAGVGALAGVAVVIGWAAVQLQEDRHLREQYGLDFARARAAASGLAPDALARAVGEGPDGLVFWAHGADAELEAQVEREVGCGGVIGRWWWRAASGVRLAGSWGASRGLPVGRVGAVVWSVLDIGLGTALAVTVVGRARRRAAGAQRSG